MNITPADVFQYVTDHPASSAVIAVSSLIAAAFVWLLGRRLLRSAGRTARTTGRTVRRWTSGRPSEDVLTIVAASIATGVSAQGMWRFSGDVLGFDGPLRVLLFAFIEVAMVTSAVRARRNMRENFKAGVDGLAVWVLTCLSAVLSSMDAGSFAEAVFRLAAPLVAAWLWERGMAIERAKLTGRTRINWRLTPERVLVRVGLAEASDRTASEVDAHRRLTRVALAAKRVRALREAGASDRKQRGALAKLDKAMDRAVEHTGLAQDVDKQERLLAQIGALYNTAGLTEVQPESFWQKLMADRAARAERDRLGAEALAVSRQFVDRRWPILGELHAIPVARVNGHDRAAVSPPNTTRHATGEDDKPRRPTRHDTRSDQPRRRAIAANGKRRDSTTARTRKGDLYSQRIVRILDLLKQKPAPTQDDIAARLGVSVRTVQRDIERAQRDGLLPHDTTGDTTHDTTTEDMT